jgi:predicted nucleic acid-binding protein
MTPPRAVFADASYYIALANRPDAERDRALRWLVYLDRERMRIVTTEAVLWEFLNFFSATRARAEMVAGYNRIRHDSAVEVVPFVPALCDAAVNLYGSRPDQEWGVTDCYSFEVMRSRGLTTALTSDHHFQQAGFTALLSGDPPK